MTAFIADRYDLFIAEETAFGVFMTDPAAFRQIRPESEKFEHQAKTEVLECNLLRAGFGHSKAVPGASSCTVKMRLPARGGGTVASDGETAGECSELQILTNICGVHKISDTGTALSGGNAGAVTVVHETPSTILTRGGLAFIDPDGSGPIQGRWIGGIDDATGAVDFASCWKGNTHWHLSSSPDENGCLYASTHMREAPGEERTSACMEISGMAIASVRPVWKYTGLCGNLKISDAAAQKRVMIDLELKGNTGSAVRGDRSVDLDSGASPWPECPADLRSLSADFRINGERMAYRSFSLDLGCEWNEVLDAGAESGRAGYVLTQCAPKGSFSAYWDPEHQGRLASGETFDLSWIVGSADNGIGFHAPAAQVRSVKESTVNGLLAMDVEFAVLDSGLPEIPPWMLAFAGKGE